MFVQSAPPRPFDTYEGSLPEAVLSRRVAALRAEREAFDARLVRAALAHRHRLAVAREPGSQPPAEAPSPIDWQPPVRRGGHGRGGWPDLGRAAWWAVGWALVGVGLAVTLDGLVRGVW